jgi:PPOX class probable F420-dependent enzyme
MRPGTDDYDRAIRLSPEECRIRATAERSARLATHRPDGAIDLVPIVFGLLDSSLYFAVDHKPKTTQRLARLRNIEHDPNVTVLFDRYSEDWTQLWWVRLRGSASVLPDRSERTTALDALGAKYEQYADLRPDGPVVRIEPIEWTGWTFAS